MEKSICAKDGAADRGTGTHIEQQEEQDLDNHGETQNEQGDSWEQPMEMESQQKTFRDRDVVEASSHQNSQFQSDGGNLIYG